MPNLQDLLEKSASAHTHLCPRQILGVRIGLAGTTALGLEPFPTGKRLLAILESDGCFADGVTAATGCTVGHRTLRVEDYGKIAATFVDVKTCRAVRVSPALDVRQRALAWACNETHRYSAQLQAYQMMPDEELLVINVVKLTTPVEQIVSRPGMRVECSLCGEEIINERQVKRGNQLLCRACAGQSYYQMPFTVPAFTMHSTESF